MSGSKDDHHFQIRSLWVLCTTRVWTGDIRGHEDLNGLLPAPNPHLYMVTQTLPPQVPQSALPMSGSLLCSWNSQVQMNSSCTAKTISQPEWRTGQSNSAKQALPIYQDELGAMNHFVSFMRFVVRNRGNKRTIRRPFTHWPFTFINTAVVSVISISPVQSLGELTLY